MVTTALTTFDSRDTRPVKIFFQDEGRFGRISDPVKCWAPVTVRPTVPKQIIREYFYISTAACPLDGENFSMILSDIDTDMMSIFLKEFSIFYKDYRVIMVMDQAAWHRSNYLKKFDNIRIIFQPPYSPELNPVEHIWEHSREKYLRNKQWDSLYLLEKELCDIFKNLSDDKETVKSLTGFKWALIDIGRLTAN